MAAVLAAAGARLSHLDAAAMWALVERPLRATIELSVVGQGSRGARPGLLVHRRRPGVLAAARSLRGIPLTDPADTVIDVAPRLSAPALERAISQADVLDLAAPARIRDRAAANPRRPGAALVRDLIDRVTFVLTASELERRFVPLATRAGLPRPDTGAMLNGYEVDFFWPALGLVVETDGGRFHRGPFQQTRDRRRDQVHLAAGLTPVRFTHGQIRYSPGEVADVLRSVAEALSGARPV